MHAPKEAARTVSPALPIPSMRDCPQTLPVLGPEIQYSVTNLFSNKALGTHLDLTFLKTSNTYAEGCNRGKTPALHIKKHSNTNVCRKVHFTQLKTCNHVLRDGQTKLNITKRKPFQLQSAASLGSSPSPKHKSSLFRILLTGEQCCEKSILYSTS